jgi:hypothetical protein
MPKCPVCKVQFTKAKQLQSVCSYPCAVAYATSKRAKADKKQKLAEKKADRVRKEKLKSRADFLREAQTVFNAFIRERDRDQPCISCGRHHTGQYHAGHYLSVGAHPELRFTEINVAKQCSACNTHLSGNVIEYRKNLIEKIGLSLVEGLEGPRPQAKYTIDEIKKIKSDYTRKLKDLKKD